MYTLDKFSDSRTVDMLNSLDVKFNIKSHFEYNLIKKLGIKRNSVIDSTLSKTKSVLSSISNTESNLTFIDENSLDMLLEHSPNANFILHLDVSNGDIGYQLDDFEFLVDKLKRNNKEISEIMVSPEKYEDFNIILDRIEVLRESNFLIDTLYIDNNFLINKIEDYSDVTAILHNFTKKGVRVVADISEYILKNTCTFFLKVLGKRIRMTSNGEPHQYVYLNDGLYGSLHEKLFESLNNKVSEFTVENSGPLKGRDGFITTTLFGPTCDSIDTLIKDTLYQPLEINDWIYITGVHFLIRESTSFNSFHPTRIIYISI